MSSAPGRTLSSAPTSAPASAAASAAASAPSTAAAPAAAPAVRIDAVSKRYTREGPPVLENVSLRIEPGEFVCLLGASGCGKSTLLNLIAGLEHPTGGALTVSGGPAAVMFQHAALFPWLSARGNVELALRLRGVARVDRRQTADGLLKTVGLADAAGVRPHTLSGGMLQRVALARALAQDRNVLLMDEPFAALDAITRDLLHEELERVWRETGRTIVFVTHNVREAVRLGQRVVLMAARPGRIVAHWRTRNTREHRIGSADASRLAEEITGRLRQELEPDAA